METKLSTKTSPDALLMQDHVPLDGGELIVRYLEQIHVEFVFGVPGGAVEPIYNALARSERRGGPKAIVARHEAGAAYMADGYMRETGRLGVCVATSGPGATNLITGVACAYDNNIPLLAITGQPALPSFGRGALQESSCTGVDVIGMYRHCTRYNSLISHEGQFETKLVNAILHSFQAPQGPAHLSVPVDILRSPLAIGSLSYDLFEKLNHRPRMIDNIAVNHLIDDIKSNANVVFFIGAGANEAIDSIINLSEILNAPFVTTPDAKGLINPSHKNYYGVFGFGGHSSADEVVKNNVDLLLAFGTDFGELSSSGWCDSILNNKLVHIDEFEENLVRSPIAKRHVRGHIGSVCETLITALLPSYPLTKSSRLSHKKSLIYDNRNAYYSLSKPIKPQRLMKELSDRFPPSTRFLADTGNSMIWAAHFLHPKNCRHSGLGYLKNRSDQVDRRNKPSPWLRLILNFATMGWAIGASIGIAHGSPDCPVVCITGDGAYTMSGQEITTALESQLTVIFVILNDNAYGMVKHGQRLAKAEPIAHNLTKIDFPKTAESMGIPGYVIHSVEDFDKIDINAVTRRRGPSIFDVRIDPEEVPPMILRLKALGSFQEEDA